MDIPKKLVWLGISLDDLKDFPEEVKDAVGYALHKVQEGLTPRNVKHLTGFKPAVMEIVSSYDTNTYRAVYTTKIGGIVYVLHCFAPKQDIDLIEQRLKEAYLLAFGKR